MKLERKICIRTKIEMNKKKLQLHCSISNSAGDLFNWNHIKIIDLIATHEFKSIGDISFLAMMISRSHFRFKKNKVNENGTGSDEKYVYNETAENQILESVVRMFG